MQNIPTYDTHVHSTFSHDGKSTFKEYAAVMKEVNIKGIGFTEHMEYLPETGIAGMFQYDSYCETLGKYQEYGYEFYRGIEIGYGTSVESLIVEDLKNKKFDYIVGSVHRIDARQVIKVIPEYIEAGKDCRHIIEKYYEALRKTIKIDVFDVIAHIGQYKKSTKKENSSYLGLIPFIENLENELIKDCVLSNKIIEINTSGLLGNLGDTMPGRRFLVEYYKKGGRLICLGSDAHSVRNLAQGFDIAMEIIKDIGYKYITLPWNKENPVNGL
jgi:histidinol-phosphatase (PHP family)